LPSERCLIFNAMQVGGLQKVSLIDYPGEISAVVFTQGCNFRCVYCHNPELVYPHLFGPPIDEKEIFDFLERRRGKIDAVVITGGEPLMQEDLLNFVLQVKAKGFLVKLDTNGSYPERLRHIMETGKIDYLAVDVKAPWSSYAKVVGVKGQVEKIKETVEMILASHMEYEFRVTVAYPLISDVDVLAIGRALQGAKRLVLQKFSSKSGMMRTIEDLRSPSEGELQNLKKALKEIIPCVVIRN